MNAPSEILELVERFERNADDYRAPQYGEAQTRIEFINPFFESLGWDIDNRRGAAEKYKDVIHEASIKIGGVTKAPDYCFRFGGNPIFFLEAKKPAVNLKDALDGSFTSLSSRAFQQRLTVLVFPECQQRGEEG